MNILVVGRGGREHTIIWSLAKSAKVKQLYCAPGNAGIAELATCVPIAETAFAELSVYAKEQAIDLIIVGPEDPLFAGAVDYFEGEGFKVFGPRQDAAIIEGSKVFAKQLMKQYDIPSAAYETFAHYEEALAYIREQKLPIVLKADGLAAGKGVIIAHTMAEAEEALREIMVDKAFGEAGNHIVIEEFLVGEEMTILAFVDGTIVRPMVPSQDHKPIFDNDEGPNTGGMGTYSPVPHVDQAIVDQAIETIVVPAAEAMVQEGRPFRGVLYAGLMLTEDGPKTIEFNCRFGDPETQVVLPRLETDLLEVMLATIEGRLDEVDLQWRDEAAVCVVMSSEGYPGEYRKGDPISGLERVKSLGRAEGVDRGNSDIASDMSGGGDHNDTSHDGLSGGAERADSRDSDHSSRSSGVGVRSSRSEDGSRSDGGRTDDGLRLDGGRSGNGSRSEDGSYGQALVFHAGTALREDGQVVTAGGRLIGVTGLGQNIAEARDNAYAAIEHIDYVGKHYRTDIAQKALKDRS